MSRNPGVDVITKKANRVVSISDKVLGAPSEIDLSEAEELLRSADIDPDQLKARFHARFDALAKTYARKGERVPPMLKQALADFRPGMTHSRVERELVREAHKSIRQLLRQVRQIPQLLAERPNLTLTTAYRRKKTLSEEDTKLLDKVAEDLEKRIKRNYGNQKRHE